jgi:hypothetical protein
MAQEELKWQNIDADDLPAEVKKSFEWLKQRRFSGYEPEGQALGCSVCEHATK